MSILYQINEIKPFTSVNSSQPLRFYTEGKDNLLVEKFKAKDIDYNCLEFLDNKILKYNPENAKEYDVFKEYCQIVLFGTIEYWFEKTEQNFLEPYEIINPYFKLSWSEAEANGALRIMDQLKYSDDSDGITKEDFNNLAEGKEVKSLQLKALHSSGQALKMHSPADYVISFENKPTNGFATVSLTYAGVKVCEDCIVNFE